MKATIINEEVYTISIGGRSVSGLRKVSEWEGMVKLQDSDGAIMILDTGSQDIVSNLFTKILEEGMHDWEIIKISPSLAASFKLKFNGEGLTDE